MLHLQRKEWHICSIQCSSRIGILANPLQVWMDMKVHVPIHIICPVSALPRSRVKIQYLIGRVWSSDHKLPYVREGLEDWSHHAGVVPPMLDA